MNLNERNKGILRLNEAKHNFSITRHLPAEQLKHLIQHYWIVTWNLAGKPPHQQDILQHPGVNIIFQRGQSRINGVESKKSSYILEGNDEIIGVLYRPGAFSCYGGREMRALVNDVAHIADYFPFNAKTAEHLIFSQPNINQKLEAVNTLLSQHIPEPDQTVDFLDMIVKRIIEDRSIIKVEQLVKEFHIAERSLQRMFKQYIGVPPKWMIQRYRMHDACELIEHGADLIQLALELGYFDQAHFTKDFKAMIGKTPKQYAKL